MRRKAGLVLLALAVTFAAGGCESEAYRYVNAFVKKWTGASIRQTLRYVFGIPTGSSIIDALVDGQREADALRVADKLWEEGRRLGDPELVDSAIRTRPNDWRYRITRAAMALDPYDPVEYSAQDERAIYVDPAGKTPEEVAAEKAAIRDRKIREFRAVADRMGGRFANRGQCETLALELRNLYEARFEATRSEADRAEAARYEELYRSCASVPR